MKDFTLYPEALELKQLGFDEPCFAFYQVEYHENSPIMVDDNEQYRRTGFRTCINSEIASHYTSCPTYSQAFRWFREKHSLGHMINGIGYESFIMNIGGILHIFNGSEFNTYEEVELRCLKHLIKTVKENENQI